MGIKDNFSQAVKELWKKDGQEQTGEQPQGAQPTELEKYLKQQTPPQNAAQTPLNVEMNGEGVPLETPYYRNTAPQGGAGAQSGQPASESTGVNMNVQNAQNQNVQNQQQNPQGADNAVPPPQGTFNQNVQNIQQNFGQNNPGGANYNAQNPVNQNYNGGGQSGGYVPPSSGSGAPAQAANETDEITVISKNTIIDGNVRSLANMQIDGNIKGNVETTKNVDISGKIVGDITCNNAGMNSAAMQGNVSLKGRIRMDRDTILIGDLSSQYADINGRVRGKLDIVGKAELKRDAIVFGDINASTIAVTDGAIIQGYVNTTFLSKEDSRNVFPEAISLENKESPSN